MHCLCVLILLSNISLCFVKEKPYYQTVVDTLKSVKRPGFFTAGGVVSLPLPSLSIGGSILGLPLCEAQAKKLIEISSRAPFGRGEETIIDTSVRCTWQLNPSQFSINNPNWEKSLDALSSKLRAELGCSDRMNIAFELYKMLLYEPGGFFKVSILGCGSDKDYITVPMFIYNYTSICTCPMCSCYIQ